MPVLEPVWQMWATFAVIAVAIACYATEQFKIELVSAGVIAALMLLFQVAPLPAGATGGALDATRLLAGFGDPALISVLALLIIGQGLVRTGALDSLIRQLSELRGLSPGVLIAGLLATVTVLSGFVNNTPMVVIFIPILGALAQRQNSSISQVMMPLSFAAILGGMTTLIGSSTNLLVSGALVRDGLPAIGFFDFLVPGAVLAGVGFLYVLFVLPRLLPDRASLAHTLTGGDGKQFIAQIRVRPNSRLIGARSHGGLFPDLKGMTVRLIQRGNEAILPPYDDFVVAAGDILVVAATRATLTEALADTPSLLPGEEQPGGADQVLVEATITPASRAIGRNLRQIAFYTRTGCIVLGIQRRSRMVRGAMDRIRLEAGDVLLLLGKREDVMALRANREVLLIEWSADEVPAMHHAGRARAVFAATVLAAASGLLPIVVAAVLGATAMVALGCLNVRQAMRAIDRRVALLVPAALAMGAALQETQGAMWLAHQLIIALADAGPALVLSALFLLIATLTNLLSNNATAVLFTPIAVSVAQELGVSPLPFVYAVIFAANCSFATPVGYQTNLLVMAPGHYQFRDFLKAGIPLIVLIWLVYSLFAPVYFNL